MNLIKQAAVAYQKQQDQQNASLQDFRVNALNVTHFPKLGITDIAVADPHILKDDSGSTKPGFVGRELWFSVDEVSGIPNGSLWVRVPINYDDPNYPSSSFYWYPVSSLEDLGRAIAGKLTGQPAPGAGGKTPPVDYLAQALSAFESGDFDDSVPAILIDIAQSLRKLQTL